MESLKNYITESLQINESLFKFGNNKPKLISSFLPSDSDNYEIYYYGYHNFTDLYWVEKQIELEEKWVDLETFDFYEVTKNKKISDGLNNKRNGVTFINTNKIESKPICFVVDDLTSNLDGYKFIFFIRKSKNYKTNKVKNLLNSMTNKDAINKINKVLQNGGKMFYKKIVNHKIDNMVDSISNYTICDSETIMDIIDILNKKTVKIAPKEFNNYYAVLVDKNETTFSFHDGNIYYSIILV